MALPNKTALQITFKEEIQNILNDFNHGSDMAMEIKTENDTIRPPADVPPEDVHNPFQNIQVQVKQEVNFSLTLEAEDSNSQNAEANINSEAETLDCNLNNGNKEIEIKKEKESLVSYDYPNFDDAGSMDSNEAAALGNVEACLQDEINIKTENFGQYDKNHREVYNAEVKMEADLTLTDTHLTPNNITATIVKTTTDIGGQPKPNALVVIHALSHKSKNGNDEAILPTSYANDNNIDLKPFHLNSLTYDEPYEDANEDDDNAESFQLNSITGNVLSLEQEAYSLLRAKKKIQDTKEKPYACTECPKMYSSKRSLRKHWEVHRTIERRIAGRLQGLKTRQENLKKKPITEPIVYPPNNKTKRKKKDTERFQLNSITGNVPSLEQEANGLLKTKKKIQDSNDQGYACTECPKIYSSKYSLRSHWEVHRTIERRMAGHLQGLKTRQKNLKKRPMPEQGYTNPPNNVKSSQVKKEGYDCTCGKVFQRRSRMETCLRSHNLFETNSNCVPCMTCTKKFKNKDELALHRKRLHRKKFPCKFCPTDYDTRKELFKHLQIHQKVQLMEYKVISEVMKGKQKLRCFMCSKSWSELSELKAHVMNDHKEPYVCPHCKNTFPKIIDFGNHTKMYHPEVEDQSVLDVLEAFSRLVQAWKCEECELQFLEADKLALHQIEKHNPELKAETQFQCTDCRRVFISQKGLTSHRRVHHSTETTEETKVEETGIMCLECRKICKDITALTSHMRLHSPERKYPCKFCDFRFATPEKRKAHAEIHTGDMKYVCFICEYQCSSENRLKHHKMSLKHANMKEYLLTGKPLLDEPQSSCKEEKIKETLRKNECSVKRRKKDKEETKKDDDDASSDKEEVACDICGDKFSSESEMLEHKQTHPFIEFPNDDKPSRIFFK